MKRVLILSAVVALALSASAVAFAHGPGARGPAGHVGAFRLGSLPQAFKDCLAKQGLTPPGREGERHARKGEHASAADLAKRKAAFEACKQYLPAPVKARQDAFEQFRSCLQKQGLPAPPARGTKPSDADKAKRKAAFEACKSLLPARPHPTATMRFR